MRTIFVYGLLKPGLSLHHVVEPFVVKSASGRTRGRLYDADVPAARFDENGSIEGFVFWLDERRLEEAVRVLDELEDEGDVYRRIVIDVETTDGPTPAFAYEYLGPLDGRREVGSVWK
jgi:gamma-glutamylcyclotransferase (GGCT)/AIG2-like uncharacterized protein YtfP